MTSTSANDRASSETSLVVLPADLINCDLEGLRQTFLAALVGAQPLDIHADRVSRAGTAAAQVLLACLRDAGRRQIPVRLLAPTSTLLEAMRCLGLLGEPELAALLAPA